MRIRLKLILSSFILIVMMSCGGNSNKVSSSVMADDQLEVEEDAMANLQEKAQRVKQNLCSNFPNELVMSYNPDAKKLEIVSIDDGNGGILDCKLKLFYGDKDYEFWEGLISAGVNHNSDNPFWQYDPKRNPNLYQKVAGVGEQAVYISNMRQLMVLKEGLMYYIAPPSHGNTTNSGKENKEIAIEIAEFYRL